MGVDVRKVVVAVSDPKIGLRFGTGTNSWRFDTIPQKKFDGVVDEQSDK